jgi:hypothetical protein
VEHLNGALGHRAARLSPVLGYTSSQQSAFRW